MHAGLDSVQQPATEPQWFAAFLPASASRLFDPGVPQHVLSTGADLRRLEQLSWKPRAYLFHGFMTAEESDHLVDLARPTVARSEVVDPATGGSVLDSVRTSHGTFLTCGP